MLIHKKLGIKLHKLGIKLHIYYIVVVDGKMFRGNLYGSQMQHFLPQSIISIFIKDLRMCKAHRAF